jgi:hypothetical protein
VPLLAAAVCPHPPLIVPKLAAGAAAELDDLRAACTEVVSRLLATGPELVCVVGAAEYSDEYSPPFQVSFSSWGLADGPPGLPLSVAVGVWLLRSTRVAVRVLTVARLAPPDECVALGEKLSRAGRMALLVMGDGSACRDLKAPGYLDPRAEPFDTAVTEALGTGDAAALRALHPVLAEELLVAGRAPWQVLAGACPAARGEVLYDKAPYGVQYTVAYWEPV